MEEASLHACFEVMLHAVLNKNGGVGTRGTYVKVMEEHMICGMSLQLCVCAHHVVHIRSVRISLGVL